MSTYGYKRDTTPNLTAIASEGVLFTNMHANATWTFPGHASLFTGTFSFVSNLVFPFSNHRDPATPFLPDILQQHGYETVFYAPQDDDTFPAREVYSSGITTWDDDYYKYLRDQKAYITKAVGQMATNRNAGKKTFLFYHTYACHGPYLTEDAPLLYVDKKDQFLPVSWVAIYKTYLTQEYYQYLLGRLPIGLENGDFHTAPQKIKSFLESLKSAPTFQDAFVLYDAAQKADFWGEAIMLDYQKAFEYWGRIDQQNPKHIEFVTGLYDQAVHTMDQELLGTLREEIQLLGLAANTIVIVTGDHGEEFMEHGELMHATLYDTNTQVPFVLSIPSVPPKVVDEHVQTVDLVPTILEAVGIQNTYTFSGKSVLPLLRNVSLGRRLIIAQGNKAQIDISTVREGDWKMFVKDTEAGALIPFELYNTALDPEEKQNVLAEHMDRAADMIRRYRVLLKKAEEL